MFTIFNFGFEIFKIAIQCAVYSSIILALKLTLTYVIKNDLLKRIKFMQIYLSLSCLMLIFSFT